MVEQYPGTGSTDFWAISFAFSSIDQQAISGEELERELKLMQACWIFFDQVRSRVPAELQKGPRGGGRDRDRIVLIFDEIVTGFRIARGGAQELYGVIPDLAVFSKALGGGLPIAAFCGSRAVMEPIGRNTVKHGGTYNGNPLCAAAALATLRELDKPGTIDRITRAGQTVAEAIRRAARDRGIPCIVQGVGGFFRVVFTADANPPRHYRDLLRADTKCFASFHQALLDEGIHINSSGLACWFTSSAHTESDLAQAVAAVQTAMKSVV